MSKEMEIKVIGSMWAVNKNDNLCQYGKAWICQKRVAKNLESARKMHFGYLSKLKC